jgi:hypothetical protein
MKICHRKNKGTEKALMVSSATNLTSNLEMNLTSVKLRS